MLQLMISGSVYESCADVSIKFQARIFGDTPKDIFSEELMVGVQEAGADLTCFIMLQKSRAYNDFLNKTKDVLMFIDLGKPGHPNLDHVSNFKINVKCVRPECINNTGQGITFFMFYNYSRVEKNSEPIVVKDKVIPVNMEK
jgi:hypothetical protein